MKRLIKFLVALTLLLFVSCSEKKLFPEETLVKIYADLLIIHDTTQVAGKASLDSIKTEVLKRYDMTIPEYEKIISEYNSNPEQWEKFFDKAIAYVNELKTKSRN